MVPALDPAQRAALNVRGAGLPHDPLAFVLYARKGSDARVGFAAGLLSGIEVAACHRTLRLAPSPGAERYLTESSGSFGGLVPPTNVAVTPGGDVFLADRANGSIKYFDACDCMFKPLPCFSPRRSSPVEGPPRPELVAPLSQLHDPTGLHVHRTRLFIADRGQHRVVIADLDGMVPRAALRLPAVTGLRKSWTPYAVVVNSSGVVYVSDPDHGRVDVFRADGVWSRGWTGLGKVTHLAIDRSDVLVAIVADFTRDPADNALAGAVEIVSGALRPLPARAADALARFGCNPIPVDSSGRLHLGSICVGGADAVFDLQGYPVAEKDKVAPQLFGKSGVYVSTALDSKRRGCLWHRVQLSGDLPERGRIEIQTTTSDVELNAAELADPLRAWSLPVPLGSFRQGSAEALVFSPPGRYLWLRLTFGGDGHNSPSVARIVVEFPRVSLRRYLPGVYGMDPSSADFTDRFTAIFDTTLRSIESRVDTLHELFNPATAPAERPVERARDGVPTVDFLSWLASCWVGVALDRQWPEATRRALLRSAGRSFSARGSRVGLERLLFSFLGFERDAQPHACSVRRCRPRPENCGPRAAECTPRREALILEHYRLRRWLFLGAGRLGDDSVLWGRRIANRSELSGRERSGNARLGPVACPANGNPATQLVSTQDPLRDPFHVYAHRFSVFVPARVRRVEWQRQGLERLLAQEAPAHTRFQIEYVEPRFRVGVQAMIGFDSVVARVPAGVRLNENSLGRGTVLPPRPTRPAAVGINTRVGETTRLKGRT